jgi:nucleoside-diphosphate-sugar epimerase
MKILLTGAAGRLGVGFGREFVSHGHEVLGLDQSLKWDAGFVIRVADLRDPRDVFNAMSEGIDAVVHLGNIPNSVQGTPNVILGDNCRINANVLEAARACNVPKFVFASSIQVVSGISGGQDDQPQVRLPYLPLDSDTPPNPRNPYALSKLLGEEMLSYYVRMGLRQGVSVRYPAVLQPEWISAQRHWNWEGDMREAFSFILLPDAARLARILVEKDLPGYRSYLISARENLARRPAADLIAEHYAKLPLRKPAGELDSLIDNTRVIQETGWAPEPAFRDAE